MHDHNDHDDHPQNDQRLELGYPNWYIAHQAGCPSFEGAEEIFRELLQILPLKLPAYEIAKLAYRAAWDLRIAYAAREKQFYEVMWINEAIAWEPIAPQSVQAELGIYTKGYLAGLQKKNEYKGAEGERRFLRHTLEEIKEIPYRGNWTQERTNPLYPWAARHLEAPEEIYTAVSSQELYQAWLKHHPDEHRPLHVMGRLFAAAINTRFADQVGKGRVRDNNHITHTSLSGPVTRCRGWVGVRLRVQ